MALETTLQGAELSVGLDGLVAGAGDSLLWLVSPESLEAVGELSWLESLPLVPSLVLAESPLDVSELAESPRSSLLNLLFSSLDRFDVAYQPSPLKMMPAG